MGFNKIRYLCELPPPCAACTKKGRVGAGQALLEISPHPLTMAKQQGQTSVRTGVRVATPPLYDIIMFNDDVTEMDFVIFLLVEVFGFTVENATDVMLTVHRRGSAVVGTYVYDLAYTLCTKATQLARGAGFPLRIEITEH